MCVYCFQPPLIDPEVMTPLTHYVIHYGPEGEDQSFSVEVPDTTASEFVVSGITIKGEVRVGVAAVNSAGSSQVAYYPHSVGTLAATCTCTYMYMCA